ncbi:MAG: homoserine dehydrogenase [Candidatus Eisenbacteria bacterium]|nr:homoserine dehydrogenase [Candidatus Eisenbacteria bacterium]
MRLLLIGFGTVGRGLAELLIGKRETLKERYGIEPVVVGISDMKTGSLYDPKGIDLAAAVREAEEKGSLAGLPGGFDGDALTLIGSAEADCVVEMTYTDIKTGEPATSHVRAALERGMHVVTTNKGPVALNLPALNALAAKKGIRFLYEGTVMSGTPVLNLIRETLAGCAITEIKGILNGTTNYILSKMEEGMDYEGALKKAQELGYAEAVPDADVLGWDALGKVTILANAVFDAHKKPADFPCEGITGISAERVADAKARGKRYKLIGRVAIEKGKVVGGVGPQEIDLSHPLAGVMGAVNALTITTDALGDVTIVGPGAGRVETGYSALIDIIHAGGAR